MMERPPIAAILALGLTQIIGYGMFHRQPTTCPREDTSAEPVCGLPSYGTDVNFPDIILPQHPLAPL
jgi:hypothetical protein